MIQLSPSILSADFSNLLEEIREVERAGAHLLHIDVMDGHFVPNISIGPLILESLRNKLTIPLDVHLMIENPDQYIEKFSTDNTKIITVHSEACLHLNRTIQAIKMLGHKAGISLNPATPIHTLDYVWNDIDVVLIMSVNPGFGGQSFIKDMLGKISDVKNEIDARGLNIDIEVDGGIKLDNVREVIEAGANVIVAGSALFGSEDVYGNTIRFLEAMKKPLRQIKDNKR